MKGLLTISLLILPFCLFGQEREIIVKGDSLIIIDENIATDPFNFGGDPLIYLKSKVASSKAVVEVNTVANQHVDNDIDTTYKFKFGDDIFEIYQWHKGENALLHGNIKTNRFPTKQGIKVGMSKSEIISILKTYSLQTLPTYLILESSEIIEYLAFEFKDDILKSVEFEGYFD